MNIVLIRKVTYFVLCVGLFCSLAFCKTTETTTPHKGETVSIPEKFCFGVQYLYTGETFYESMAIRDQFLIRTYFNDDGRCAKSGRSPCWTKEDLVTTKADLSASEVETFKKLIEDSNFMRADPDPEGVAGKQRFYSYTLTVQYKGGTQKIVTGSFPGSNQSPTSVRSTYRMLMDLAKSKGISGR